MSEAARDGFRSVAKFPGPGALSRARALLLGFAPHTPAMPFDDWASLASICETAWFGPSRRPAARLPFAELRVVRRRLRLLTSTPTPFAVFASLRAGDGPVHLRGTCAGLPGQDAAGALWRVEAGEDGAIGRVLIEEARDFLLSVEDTGIVYVVTAGGHLVSATPLRPGDRVSVFGFADEVPDRHRVASSPHGRGGLLPAIRSGAELPLLVTHARGEPASVVR